MAFRLASIEGRAALVEGNDYHDLEQISGGRLSTDPMAALAQPDALSELTAALGDHAPTGRLANVTPGPPVPRPRNCFGIGLNYRNHAEEGNMPIPSVPLVFSKFPSCIAGPTSDVELRSDWVDYEGELVAVVGREARDVAVDGAWDCVAGLCVGQDVSDRAVQFTSLPPQFDLGKSFDTYGPIGPVLVSPDALDSPGSLALETKVNGETRQKDSTGDLIFDVPRLISYLSHITSLQPGDLVFTGTPGGVGAASGRFLKNGDVVETTIEGLGTLTNRCVQIADHPEAGQVSDRLRRMLV